MKRLNLEDFQAKNKEAVQQDVTDTLLGQVLGNCHDDDCNDSGSSDDDDMSILELAEGFLERLKYRFNLEPIPE